MEVIDRLSISCNHEDDIIDLMSSDGNSYGKVALIEHKKEKIIIRTSYSL